MAPAKNEVSPAQTETRAVPQPYGVRSSLPGIIGAGLLVAGDGRAMRRACVSAAEMVAGFGTRIGVGAGTGIAVGFGLVGGIVAESAGARRGGRGRVGPGNRVARVGDRD